MSGALHKLKLELQHDPPSPVSKLVCNALARYSSSMPTVHREAGYVFYFYAEEGIEPPHVHVDKGDGTAKL